MGAVCFAYERGTLSQSLNSYSYANDNPITKSDPSGRFVPEAVIGAIVGTVVGVGAQATQDYLNGRASGLDKYAAAAAGGFVAGGIIGATDGASLLLTTTVYGPVAGASNAVVQGGVVEGINSAGGGRPVNWNNVFGDVGSSALFGAIPGLDLLPGFNSRGAIAPVAQQIYTKLDREVIKNISAATLLKVFGISFINQTPGAANGRFHCRSTTSPNRMDFQAIAVDGMSLGVCLCSRRL